MVKHEVLSRAKINLMLRIIGRRDDGYHELQTHFQLLEWGDQMTFKCIKLQGSNEVHIKGFEELPTEKNLIYKAAMAIKGFAKNTSDWLVEVNKQIPQGAGLGGGSSNAAQTLRCLNVQWECGLSQQALMEMGKGLGADVPIFIAGHSATASGIGADLVYMAFDTPYILLLFPETSINTAALFNQPMLKRNQVALAESDLLCRDLWINDFFPLVLNQYEEIAYIYEHMKDLFHVRLSGSGSTLFGIFNDKQQAENAYKKASQITNSLLVTSKMNGIK